MAETGENASHAFSNLKPAQAASQSDNLRSMVRHELRKLFEAQHQGIIAMLGALGEDQHQIKGKDKQLHHQRGELKTTKQVQQNDHDAPNVLNALQDTSLYEPSSLTEVDITPLPSDEASLKSLDRPLTVSDLFRSKTRTPGAKHELRHMGSNVTEALHEMKTLRNHDSLEGKERVYRSQGQIIPRLLQVERPSSPKKEQTFSRVPQHSQPIHLPPQQSHLKEGLPSTGNEIPDTGQPFARVFQMLKQMNKDMVAQSGLPQAPGVDSSYTAPRLPLLHIPPPEVTSAPFPIIPGRTNGESRDKLPLLHLYTPHHRHEVPVRDVTTYLPRTTKQTPRMPLLHMTAPPRQARVFQHIGLEQNKPILVPDEVIRANELRCEEEQQTHTEVIDQTRPVVDARSNRTETHGKDRGKRWQEQTRGDDQQSRIHENQSTTIHLVSPAEDSQKQALETMSQYVQVDSPVTTTHEVQTTSLSIPLDTNTSTRGMQFPTPRVPSQEESIGEEASRVEEDRLHHGYALASGLFDEYLLKNDGMNTALDGARLHRKATFDHQPKKLKEQGTETEGPGWSEVATITCRDQGTDPVAEPLEAYIKNKQNLKAGGFVAPDVFTGMTFSDAGAQTVTQPGSEGAVSRRAFINVVDLDEAASADFVSSLSEKSDSGPKQSEARTSAPLKTKVAPKGKAPASLIDRHRAQTKPTQEEEESLELELVGPDPVTTKALSGQSTSGKRRASSSRASPRSLTLNKVSIRTRLEDMDMQFDAIEAMSRNIEEDYKNARLMIHTIEQLGEAVQPSPEVLREESIDNEEYSPSANTQVPYRHLASHEHIGPSRKRDQSPTGKTGPVTVAELDEEKEEPSIEVQLSDKRGGLGQIVNDQNNLEQESRAILEEVSKLDSTGLSGVSNEMEVTASAYIDTAGYGLSTEETHELLNKIRDKKTIKDTQKSLIQQKLKEEKRLQAEKDRQQIKIWMEEKRRERYLQFKKHQQELRERERHPYRLADDSGEMSTLTFKEFEEWEKNRVISKKQQETHNTAKRLQEANDLMDDILTDRPVLPQQPQPSRKTTMSTKGRNTSPASKATSQTFAKKGVLDYSPRAARYTSPERSGDARRSSYYRPPKDSAQSVIPREHRSHDQTGFAGRSGILNRQTGTSNTDLQAYSWNLNNTKDSFELDSEVKENIPEYQTDQPNKQAPAQYTPKPFTQIVRLQRPEITRDTRPRAVTKSHIAGPSETSQANSTPITDTPAKHHAEKHHYGTKRLSSTRTEWTGPRRVRTYQERLREMKQVGSSQHGPIRYTSPHIQGRGALNKSWTGEKRQVTRPRKKPLTYSQQLKALQPPKEQYRTGLVNAPTFTRGKGPVKRGPSHKPVTYQEQLRKLQPPKKTFRTKPAIVNQHEGPEVSSREYHYLPHRQSLERTGPYPSPYRTFMDDKEDLTDRASVISPWELDGGVRQLIYDDTTSSYVGASRTSTDLDLAELHELAGTEDPEYTDLVCVEQIADAASVSDGSVLSFIDWDQIDDLIADVN